MGSKAIVPKRQMSLPQPCESPKKLSSLKDETAVPLLDRRGKAIRRVFFSSRGLHAVWGVFFFLLTFEIVESCLTNLLGHYFSLKPNGLIPPALALIRESCELLAVVTATWTMARIENVSMFSYGFTDRHRIGKFGAGVFWGVLSLSLLVLVLWMSRMLVFDGIVLTGLYTWSYATVWLLVFLLVGLFEESLLRGYLQYKLSQTVGFWYAAAILSVAFALMHLRNSGESKLGILSVGVGGILFCISLRFTKSLFWAVGFHTGWDWGQSYLYGTANSGLMMEGHLLASHPSGNPLWSGGTAGPEASAFLLPLFALAALCMWLWWARPRTNRFN